MNPNNDKLFTVLRWTKASFLGWLAGVVLIIMLSSFLDSIGIEHMQFYIGVGMGLGVGVLQWRIIRSDAGIGAPWIWTTVLGMGVPFLINDILSRFGVISFGSYYLPASIAPAGLLTGLLQYFVLKPHYSGAARWIAVCAAGWITASLTVLAIDYTKLLTQHNLALFFINLTLIVAGGAVLGSVTGPMMKKILSGPNRRPE